MKKKFVVKILNTPDWFVGGDFQGPNTDTTPRLFDSYKQAETRINEEFELFPGFFKELILKIEEVIVFEK